MKRTPEHVAKWHNTENKFARLVEQVVCDYYRHADTAEELEYNLTVCEEVAVNTYHWTPEKFAHAVADFKERFAKFYADEKTVAALMACNH